MDGLEAEVAALKLLVITSTPSNPGKKGHRRAPSADQICSDCQTYHSIVDGTQSEDSWDVIDIQDEKEVCLNYLAMSIVALNAYLSNKHLRKLTPIVKVLLSIADKERCTD